MSDDIEQICGLPIRWFAYPLAGAILGLVLFVACVQVKIPDPRPKGHYSRANGQWVPIVRPGEDVDVFGPAPKIEIYFYSRLISTHDGDHDEGKHIERLAYFATGGVAGLMGLLAAVARSLYDLAFEQRTKPSAPL